MKMYSMGGIDEAGRNMVAFEVNNEIVICDMGLDLGNLVKFNNEIDSMSVDEMIEKDIIADPSFVLKNKDKVKAIVISHAHLDHVGGAEYLASFFDCPIYGTPFTIEVLKVLMKSRKNVKRTLRNKFVKLNVNSRIELSDDIVLEFINVTHSTPQSVIVAIHTKEGVIMYANDFKFDNRPGLGQAPNYDRLREIAQSKGVKLLVVDSLRSNRKIKTLSEIVIKEMLRDIFIEAGIVNTRGIIITTYASHITRLKFIYELSKEFGRKVVFAGRSMKKYSLAARNAGIINFESKGVEIAQTPHEVNKLLEKVNKNKSDYVVVCTGHQGEDNAILSRIVDGKTPYNLNEDDAVIFSSEVIPTKENIEASQILQSKLEPFRCKVYRDIHVSGHASREDHRDLLNMIKPQIIVPAHGDRSIKEGMIELAKDLGYKEGENLLLVKNQEIIEV